MTLVDEVLDGLELRSTVFSRTTPAGEWGFAKDELRCLRLKRTDETVTLGAGDVVVLPLGDQHDLLAYPGAMPMPWRSVVHRMGWTHWTPGMRFKSVDLHFGSGKPTATLITGVLAFGDHRRNPLLHALPEMLLASSFVRNFVVGCRIVIGQSRGRKVLLHGWLRSFIQVVRQYLTESETLPRGWLRTLADQPARPSLPNTVHRHHDVTATLRAVAIPTTGKTVASTRRDPER